MCVILAVLFVSVHTAQVPLLDEEDMRALYDRTATVRRSLEPLFRSGSGSGDCGLAIEE